MSVPGRVYADGMPAPDDPALQQVANVAFLPGIVGASLAMPDIHWGYGFPIGGVAAVDAERRRGLARRRGLRHQLRRARCSPRALAAGEVRPAAPRRRSPSSSATSPPAWARARAIPRLSGARARRGAGAGAPAGRWRAASPPRSDDLEHCEEGGRPRRRRPGGGERAGPRARRGPARHARERQPLPRARRGGRGLRRAGGARPSGSCPGDVAVQIHSGSRGLGYQVCDEALAALRPRHVAATARTTRRSPTRSSPARRCGARPGGSTSPP